MSLPPIPGQTPESIFDEPVRIVVDSERAFRVETEDHVAILEVDTISGEVRILGLNVVPVEPGVSNLELLHSGSGSDGSQVATTLDSVDISGLSVNDRIIVDVSFVNPIGNAGVVYVSLKDPLDGDAYLAESDTPGTPVGVPPTSLTFRLIFGADPTYNGVGNNGITGFSSEAWDNSFTTKYIMAFTSSDKGVDWWRLPWTLYLGYEGQTAPDQSLSYRWSIYRQKG